MDEVHAEKEADTDYTRRCQADTDYRKTRGSSNYIIKPSTS